MASYVVDNVMVIVYIRFIITFNYHSLKLLNLVGVCQTPSTPPPPQVNPDMYHRTDAQHRVDA